MTGSDGEELTQVTEPTFGQRLQAAITAHGPLCAGIDPHRALVESWGLDYDVAGLEAFTQTCVEAFAGHVGVVKPQSAFFEVFGSAGRGRARAGDHGPARGRHPRRSSTPSGATSGRP